MNQPSAEELRAFINERLDLLPIEAAGIAKDILDRYHLIDKAEPIPGAADLRKDYDQFMKTSKAFEKDYMVDANDRLDIYPKGTVARLMGEVEELKESLKWFSTAFDNAMEKENSLIKDKVILQAEVDRLKGENERLVNLGLELVLELTRKKPEDVGCRGIGLVECDEHENVTKIRGWDMKNNRYSGRWWKSCPGCPDCQAKAMNQKVSTADEYLARLHGGKKVVLPEVPVNVFEKGTSFYQLIEGYRAVKEWIESQSVKAHLEGRE